MNLKNAARRSLPLLLIAFVFGHAGCMLFGMGGGDPESGRDDKEILYTEGVKAMEAKDYEQAIHHFQTFADEFPKSKQYTWALQRLGESYEGLLDFYYTKKIAAGKPEPDARREFLARFGKYKCWNETPDGLQYNRAEYKKILEKFPMSNISDEAAYRMIVWEKDYHGNPAGALRELADLENVLSHYKDTSLKPEILYKIARRCRTLYEMYSFSPRPGVRNPEKAAEYFDRTKLAYRLCLESSDKSDYGQRAWSELESFEQGGRIYILK